MHPPYYYTIIPMPLSSQLVAFACCPNTVHSTHQNQLARPFCAGYEAVKETSAKHEKGLFEPPRCGRLLFMPDGEMHVSWHCRQAADR